MSKIKWEPLFYAELDQNEEDADNIRDQECCTSCGACIGDLPGYYYIECDLCPMCRQNQIGLVETWSEELKRLFNEYDCDAEESEEYLSRCEELGI